MSSICTDTSCWILLVVVLLGIAGQAGLIWWASRRHKIDPNQVAAARARLIEDAFDRMAASDSSQQANMTDTAKEGKQ